MHNKLRWDDLKVVLAISEAGSLSGAGRKLGLNHATIFRRLGEMESRLGARLFDRARTGYTPTPAGEEATTVADRIHSEVLDIERRIAGRDLRPSGSVCVTTTDTLLVGLLSPIFARFGERYRDISLEIAVSNTLFSLSRREADVAIRPTLTPPEPLVGRKIGTIAQAIYAPAELVAKAAGKLDIQCVEWVGPDERMAYHALDNWMEEQAVNLCCRYRVDTLFGMYVAVKDGIGVAVLPCYLGESDKRLARVGSVLPGLATDLWLLTHADLRKTARVRAVMDFMAEAVSRQRNRLAGVGRG